MIEWRRRRRRRRRSNNNNELCIGSFRIIFKKSIKTGSQRANNYNH
jgi:hypothetical protein